MFEIVYNKKLDEEGRNIVNTWNVKKSKYIYKET